MQQNRNRLAHFVKNHPGFFQGWIAERCDVTLLCGRKTKTRNIPCNQETPKCHLKQNGRNNSQTFEICMYPICLFAFAMSRFVPSIVCLCKVGFVREKWPQWNVNIVPGPNWWSWQWLPFKKLDSQNSPKLYKVDVANGGVTWFDGSIPAFTGIRCFTSNLWFAFFLHNVFVSVSKCEVCAENFRNQCPDKMNCIEWHSFCMPSQVVAVIEGLDILNNSTGVLCKV